jgi:mRNA-degrading endonuclease RelE of RelBE toxin-antitoxin system
MQVEFRKTFKQDLKNLKDGKVLKRIQRVVEEVELANALSDIRNIKLLQGHEDFYRIRVGDYRVGLWLNRCFGEVKKGESPTKRLAKLYPFS